MGTDEQAEREQAQQRRTDKARQFELHLTDDAIGIAEEILAEKPTPDPAAEPEPPKPETPVAPAPQKEEKPTEEPPREPKQQKGRSGCLKRLLYVLCIVTVSVVFACAALLFLVDAVGLGRSSKPVDVEIPLGSSTQDIAQILQQEGVIGQPLFFRIYSRITKADGTFQQGTFSLTPNMGYTDIVEVLQTATPRKNVTVTIPEGYTVEQIARLLAEKEVCTEDSFYEAVQYGEFDYDFVKEIPSGDQPGPSAGRIYRLEGYLFPDTYNFYLESTGESVIERMLDNFRDKVMTDANRAKMKELGWTVDQTVIIASLVQGEAATKDEMYGVSRVLHNRMEPGSGYPKLQLCSTRDYIKKILPTISGLMVSGSAYNTYEREGLPAGAINNPGELAFLAALSPSNDPAVKDCYFFATDYNTATTYFSKTYAQHEAICRKYRIGIYG